jgi:dipeptide transport system substrate-binding protein
MYGTFFANAVGVAKNFVLTIPRRGIPVNSLSVRASALKPALKSAMMISMALLSMTAPAQAAKTLVYCSEGSPSSFNPQLVTDGTSLNASSRQLYNRLVEFKYGETVIAPSLAESCQISKDQLAYTFKLRKGVKFHSTAGFKPTRDFNADDVLFSFNRQRQKDHPFNKVGGGSYEYFDSMELGSLIKDIVKVDDYTVRFELTKPEAPFLANLAMDFTSILSKEYADQVMKAGAPDKLDNEPVGTGPFILTKYSKDEQIRYKANPDYFKGKAKLDNLVFAITPDASVRYQKLKVNECQLISEPAPADLKAIAADAKLSVIERPGLNVAYLAINTKKAPFDKLEVRQAVHHALNRKAYIDAIYLGNAQVAKNPIPPTIWSYNDSIKDYAYDPEKAKALLKKAGHEKGLEIELWTMPVSRPYNPNGKKMGEMMQADLEKVGIKAKLVTFDWPTYLAKSKEESATYSLIQFGWTGDNGDPDNFLNVLLSCSAVAAGSNYAKWCQQPFDGLVQKARTQTKLADRTKSYQQAQKVFKEQAPWVTLAHSKVYRALSKRVTGYKIDPFGGDGFYPVDLNPASK